MQVQLLSWEDHLEGKNVNPLSIRACKIHWTEEPGVLQSKKLYRIRQDWTTNYAYTWI